MVTLFKYAEISGSHGGEYEDGRGLHIALMTEAVSTPRTSVNMANNPEDSHLLIFICLCIVLTVCFKLINFVFQIWPPFLLKALLGPRLTLSEIVTTSHSSSRSHTSA
jgi:hypothetical protein